MATARSDAQKSERRVELKDFIQALIQEKQPVPDKEALISILTGAQATIEALGHEIFLLKKERFGKRTEKVHRAQLSLFAEIVGELIAQSGNALEAELDQMEVESPSESTSEAPEKKKPKKKGRTPLVPHHTKIIPVPEEERPCPECGQMRCTLGHVKSVVVEYTPPKVEIIKYLREKLVCRPCDGQIGVAPLPKERVIEGALPGPQMLASLIVAKAVDGMPLQRSRKVYKRAGADLSVRTLNRWELLGHRVLKPLIQRMESMVLSSDLITLDDTHLTVRDPSATGGTQSGHLWVYVGHYFDADGDLSKTQRYISYKYAPTWAAEYPEKFLFGCQAILQGDAYRGYDRIVSPNRGDCIAKLLAGCSMHARRPFKQALDIRDPLAPFFIQKYQAIYQVEAEAKERRLTASQRLELRREMSLPLMESIKTRAQELSGLPLTKPMQQGVTYFLNQWDRLIVPFRDDGRLELDNGESERRLRRVAQGRKAWLFAGSQAGADRFAGDLSMVATAEAAGLEPGDYIQRILPIVNDWPNRRIDELLPPNWRIDRDAFLAEERARQASQERR